MNTATHHSFEVGSSISVVVPALNEAENIRSQVEEIMQALQDENGFEIIYVDDGSSDTTPMVMEQLAREIPQFRYVRHQIRCGQSRAVLTGVRLAKNQWIATLDGDGQNDPADIPRLLAKLKNANKQASTAASMQIIAGWRQQRQDNWLRRLSSRLANAIRMALLNDATPDSGCGLKVFGRELFLSLPYFDHMHRFLPALVIRAGGEVISEPVNHRPRQHGVSKYGFHNRVWVGIVDLFGVMWLIRRSSRPIIKNTSAP